MTSPPLPSRPTIPILELMRLALLLYTLLLATAQAQPSPAANLAFDQAASQIELRPATPIQLQPIQRIPEPAPPGALLHHWRATAFAPNARAADFERLLRDFPAYPRRFAPQVLSARATPTGPDSFQLTLRVQQHHVLTLTLDSTYNVTFTPTTSTSRSETIHELASSSSPDHGFLWRLNSYWTWQQRPDGLLLSLECLSLSRALPTGLAWALRPYIESVPRESLEFTLNAALKALASLPKE